MFEPHLIMTLFNSVFSFFNFFQDWILTLNSRVVVTQGMAILHIVPMQAINVDLFNGLILYEEELGGGVVVAM